MAFPNVVRIARQHYKALMSSAVGVVTVSAWLDDYGQAIRLHVYRLSSADSQFVADAKSQWGDIGAKCAMIARACFLIDGTEKARAFADTDLDVMRTAMDKSVLDDIYNQTRALLGA